jgi:hypothetical protein
MNWQLFFKITTGIIIVPISIISSLIWPWWQKAPIALKILTGPIVIPIVGFAYLTTNWWNGM